MKRVRKLAVAVSILGAAAYATPASAGTTMKICSMSEWLDAADMGSAACTSRGYNSATVSGCTSSGGSITFTVTCS